MTAYRLRMGRAPPFTARTCKASFLLTALFVSLLITGGATPVSAQTVQPAQQAMPPLTIPQRQYYQQHPDEFQQLINRLSAPHAVTAAAAPVSNPASGAWTALTGSGVSSQAWSNPQLMTDGTVLLHVSCTGSWYKLTPDINGNYADGAITQIASLPSGYTPRFFGGGVLPDGRYIIEGGEYNTGCNEADTTLGAIYDPSDNTWSSVNPPSGWTRIGDAAGSVLDNGTYMQTNCCNSTSGGGLAALLNASTLTWTATGSGKFDIYDEEAISKLPGGTLLDVDAYVGTGTCGQNSELYNPSTRSWSSAGNVVNQESDCSNPGNNPSFELGPLVMRLDGTAVIFPGLTCSDTKPYNSNCNSTLSVSPVVDIYTVNSGTWASGPAMPSISTTNINTGDTLSYTYTLADAPAAVLPDGNILFAASPSYETFQRPTHFFELDINSNTIAQVNDAPDSSQITSFQANFLVLPTGQILMVDTDIVGDAYIYTPQGSARPSWQPVITSAPRCVTPGGTYMLSGTQLNGLSEGSYYGDDVNAAVNFPIVRVVNNSTGHVFYAKTFNHSTRSIAPGASVTTNFMVASNTEGGPSTLYDVGAGIASAGVQINIETDCLVASHDFNGDGMSDILWRDTSGNVAMWLMNGGQVANSAGVGGASPSVWSIAGQRDFNGDGTADILWHDTSGNVAMWFMNGASVLGSTGVGGADPSVWSIAGTGDFNGDGKGDILWHDTSGNVALWEMNGGSVTRSCGIGNADPSVWSIVGTGDFNGDGKTDILWHDTAGNVAIWFMNGCSIIQSAGVGNASPTVWSIAGTGDFNGDGKSDILWHDTAGNVAMWMMNGAAILQSSGVGNVNPSVWSIAETGDFNGDGMSDILWHDTSGDVAVWDLNAAAILQSAGIGNASASVWTLQGLNAD